MGGHGVRLKLSVAESLRDKSGRRTAAVQDASRDLAPREFRQVLDCGCPSAAFGAADLVTDTFNRTQQCRMAEGFRRSLEPWENRRRMLEVVRTAPKPVPNAAQAEATSSPAIFFKFFSCI